MAVTSNGTVLSGSATTVYEIADGSIYGIEFLATGADATLTISTPGRDTPLDATTIIVDSDDTVWYTLYSRKGFHSITATGVGSTLRWRPVFVG